MATHTSAVDLLAGLSADEIRARLAIIEAERKALLTLLRAAVCVERGKERDAKTREVAR